MSTWLTTSHGDTYHNQPGTPNYVEGEPPIYPKTAINYTQKCLSDGFARIGYPNTGDLRNQFINRLAPAGYSFADVNTISKSDLTQSQLKSFASILAGDTILIPASDYQTGQYVVHIGRVLTIDRMVVMEYMDPRPFAYYYYHNIAAGDYYECAHRVNVQWAKNSEGEYLAEEIPDIGGLWRLAFGEIHKAKDKIRSILKIAHF